MFGAKRIEDSVLWCVVFTVVILSFGPRATAQYSGGTGEPNDPYQIATAADLIALSETPGCGQCFILTADIDLDPNLPGRKVFDSTVVSGFGGIFDGNGHIIRHLTVRGDSHLGLFSQLTHGQIMDLGVVDVNITGSGSYVGGLVGYNDGFVTRCYSTGRVSGSVSVGGLVGYNDWGYVGEIISCYSTARVQGSYGVGGLVGTNVCTVIDCYAQGSVSGNSGIGGLVGANDMDWGMGGPATGYIARCYSTGLVTGDTVGGLVGWNWCGDIGERGVSNIICSEVAYSFWDMQTSGQATSAGGTGLTTAELQTASTFVGWDGCGWTILEDQDYPHLAWENRSGDVIGSTFGGGTGTTEDPYVIYTAEQLNAIGVAPCTWDRHFTLMADIDLAGFDGKEGRPVFNVIGQADAAYCSQYWLCAFTGVFDGNGHVIEHLTLTLNDVEYGGLISVLGPGGEVRDLGLPDVNIVSSANATGALVGSNSGTVTRCYSTGFVNGIYSVGGLVGSNYTGSTVTQCYSTCMVTGDSCVGGLAGVAGGTLSFCYSTGEVSGESSIGGLVGHNTATIEYCYSVGPVSGDSSVGGLVGNNLYPVLVHASFWDIETSGQTESGGGEGKTTVEMQNVNTFVEWGSCGNRAIWTIDEGRDTPRLLWETHSVKPTETLLFDFELSDFLAGEGTPENPYLIYTVSDIDLTLKFPCEQDKSFRLMFLAGEGTSEKPYQIFTAEELCILGLCPFRLSGHFRLMADISLSEFDGQEGRPSFQPIGSYGGGFAGVFDGDEHTISNLTVTGGGDVVGLFGILASEGEILDLGIVDVNITSGYVVAALVGRNAGTVTACYSTGMVTAGSTTGGLVGVNNGGALVRCYNAAAVKGGSPVGGLVGDNNGIVSQCYNIGDVHAGGWAGGLVGRNYRGVLVQCYSRSSVTGSSDLGGLVGRDFNGTLTQCYSTGTVEGTTKNNIGGLVGGSYQSAFTACFWDTQTSGQSWSNGGTGKITYEMQMAGTFLDAGWDFVDETANGTEDIWKIVEGIGYPRLAWEKYSGGTGEPNDPYQIATAADLIALGETADDYNKHFILTADIDLDPNLPGRKVFDKAVIAPASYVFWEEFLVSSREGIPFTGVFDGNDHIISHLTIAGVDYLGLFGYLGPTAEIRAVGVECITVDGTGMCVSGLAGHCAGGTLSRCYSTGTVRGGSAVGGLAGATFWGGRVAQCHSNALVVGDSDVGGLIGSNGGSITQCFSTGTVSGIHCVGGLMGNNGKSMEEGWEGNVANSYSTSDVSGVERVGGLVGDNDDGSVVNGTSITRKDR